MRLNWNSYFMAIAQLSALRSNDPSSKIGACIVNSDNQILGIGYNGFPRGVSEKSFSWNREGEWIDTKYPFVCHAELNAISNTSNKFDLKGSTIYTSLFPCNECAKMIIQFGIKHVVYLEDKYADKDEYTASKMLLKEAQVHTEKFNRHGQQEIYISLEKVHKASVKTEENTPIASMTIDSSEIDILLYMLKHDETNLFSPTELGMHVGRYKYKSASGWANKRLKRLVKDNLVIRLNQPRGKYKLSDRGRRIAREIVRIRKEGKNKK